MTDSEYSNNFMLFKSMFGSKGQVSPLAEISNYVVFVLLLIYMPEKESSANKHEETHLTKGFTNVYTGLDSNIT